MGQESLILQVFSQQVDPVFKFLHRPSLSRYFIDGQSYLSHEPSHPAPKALKSAVFYAASCSMDNEQCLELFQMKRDMMVAKYHQETEVNLQRADYLNQHDFTTLQALVLFLLFLQTKGQFQQAWTMLSLALRIAQSLSLHLPDSPFPVSPCERELRRRLWHAIGFLDLQTSYRRCSEPMMRADWLQSHTLSNTNDIDFSYPRNTPLPPAPNDTFTDATFPIIIAEAQCAARSLSFSSFLGPVAKDMTKRQQKFSDFRRNTLPYLAGCNPNAVPFHWFVKEVVSVIHASLQLEVLEPLDKNSDFVPPPVPEGGMLKLAAKTLEATRVLCQDSRSKPFRWFLALFLPWHALSVALDNIYLCDDPALFESCWPLVDQTYSRIRDQETLSDT
ncbi:fungal-specific transcription factor domain-containing protein [Aspergillus cavernicola]|uniref:Fungal-specific transcription factor domain-containing protein n=1 Tax=Aspergillus cavernicola TaxID=176166 RepID=A0ABR4IXK6_9EURO